MNTIRNLYRTVKSRIRDSLPLAASLTIGSLLVAAALVLWLTGRPQGGDWWDIHYDTLEWKERLTIAGAVAAGAGAAIALVVAYRKQRDAEEGKFAQAFADAAAQLGNDSAAVRMAGAYALAALSDKHTERRQQCIDALCSYLRLNYSPQANEQNLTSTTRSRDLGGTTASDTINYSAGDREVRLTIIRVIRDHLQDPKAATSWCGHNLDFTGATFDGGDFSGAKFSADQVSFMEAKFEDGIVSFKDATFSSGDVMFQRAMFEGGLVAFWSASFSGARVWFNGAEFIGGGVAFHEASFSDGQVSFDYTSFASSRMQFGGATFSGADVSFRKATFSGGQVLFNQVTYSGGRVGFEGATFSGGEVTDGDGDFRGLPTD